MLAARVTKEQGTHQREPEAGSELGEPDAKRARAFADQAVADAEAAANSVAIDDQDDLDLLNSAAPEAPPGLPKDGTVGTVQ